MIRFRDSPDFREFFEADDFVVIALAAGFPHEGLVGDELGEVLVRGDHEGLEAGAFRAFDERADDVIRFEAVDLENRDVEGAAERFDMRDGGGEFLRHFIALRLVGRVFDVARSRRGGVEGDADMGGIFLFENGEQRIDEPVKRGGVDSFRVPNGGLDQREMGAIDEGHAIEQEKAVHGGRLRGGSAGVQPMSGGRDPSPHISVELCKRDGDSDFGELEHGIRPGEDFPTEVRAVPAVQGE
jgi:hypothetical protein